VRLLRYPALVTRTPRPAPPPLEANDRLVTAVLTVGWAVALAVLLILRGELPPTERWWVWTCLAGLVMGLFGLWYVPRLKRSRASRGGRR
jgi:drug/metabolite transporter (DMT)-like permease